MREESPSKLTSEADRLAALDKLQILGTPAEKLYDDITELAAFICGTPVSLVSLVGRDTQFFKSAHNVTISETPRDQSFCAHTLGTAQMLVVEDARLDARFAHNPMVQQGPKIRFYAGAPIFGEGGHVLGTLCVIDQEPRRLTAQQARALEALAGQVTELLHQRYLNHQLEQTAEDLKRRTLQLELAVDAGQLGIYTWFLDSDAWVWENERMFEIFGRGAEQGSVAPAQGIDPVLFAEDRQAFRNAVAGLKTTGDRLQWTGRFHHRDGEIRWLEVLGSAERNAQGGLVLVGTVADISDRKRSEVADQADRDRLQIALEGSDATTFDWEPEGGQVLWGGVAPYGRDPEDVPTAAAAFELVHPEDTGRLQAAIGAATAPNDQYTCDFRAFWPDGSVHWMRTLGRILEPGDGAPRRIVGVNQDVTKLKTAEQKLAIEQERLQIALRAVKATTFDWVPDTDAVTWSGLSPFGVDAALIPTGAASLEFVHEEDRERLIKFLGEALRSRSEGYAYEYRSFWADGSLRWIRTSGRVVQEVEGLTHVIGVNIDVTDRKLAEEALLHTEKLSAVGRLATVISHEINNPLESVTNLLYIVRGSPSLSREDREYLEQADRELARVVQITSQTLSLHRSVDHAVKIDADVLAQELVALYRSRLTASHVRTRFDLQEDVVFEADEGEIRQVLNNLIGNAFDAMRQGGTLRIRSRHAMDQRTGRRGVSITVADNGPGIAKEAQSRIFQAFYSTKGINGKGLSLWISKRIVRKHQGTLRFRTYTGPRHGTAFRLWLPVQAAAAPVEDWA